MRTKRTITDIREFCEGINLPTMWEYVHATELNDCETFDELTDLLIESGYFNVEIIYYDNAINYLLKNDPSFTRAFDLVAEYGLNIQDLNSERLASIVASADLEEFYHSKREAIEEFLES